MDRGPARSLEIADALEEKDAAVPRGQIGVPAVGAQCQAAENLEIGHGIVEPVNAPDNIGQLECA